MKIHSYLSSFFTYKKGIKFFNKRKRLKNYINSLTINILEKDNLGITQKLFYMLQKYNVNKIAGSNLGKIFSKDVRNKMSIAKKGKPGNKKNAYITNDSKKLMRLNSGMANKITMLDENNQVLAKFNSIQIASETTGISRNRISRCARKIRKNIIENGKIFRFEYTHTSIPYGEEENK